MLKILGINNEQTTCDCCGRTNLKKTVVLTNGETEVRYGTECAANALRIAKKDVEKELRRVERAASEERMRQDQIRRNREWDEYAAWLMATYGDTRSDLHRASAYRIALAG